jgi:hypothetical protein
MKYIKYLALAILLVVLSGMSLLFKPSQANGLSGSDFNAGHIIDDSVFYNKNTMNTGDIQNFLNAKEPSCQAGYTCLNNYSLTFSSIAADAYCGGITGGNKSAAEVIFDVAQACNINPEVLLVLLQKEQGLIASTAPTAYQYQFATGFCVYDNPSSEPPACQGTDGFSNQVYYAARTFQKYAQHVQGSFVAGQVNQISYSPTAGCGSSGVGIQNQTTASLYDYTPYQPDQAALNNLNGTGDSCSSYGNRNFWRDFNNWFGPSIGGGFTIAYDDTCSSACQQYVIYGSIKQPIDSSQIITDWGLGGITAEPMDPSILNQFTTAGNPLGRLYRINGGAAVYFVDGGNSYWVSSSQMMAAWNNFNGDAVASVPSSLANMPSYAGTLTYNIKNASSNAQYMVDGGDGSSANSNNGNIVLRQYPNTNVLQAFEGDNVGVTTITDTSYFNQMVQGAALSASGVTVKTASDPSQYQVIAGQKMYLSGAVALLYNQTPQIVSQATINRLFTTSPASPFIRLPGNGVTIYMVDNDEKDPVSSVNILQSWLPTGANINILNNGFLNLLTTGQTVNSYEADVSGQLYVMSGGNAITVPSDLDSTYRIATPFSVDSSLIALYGSQTATAFAKNSTDPSVYLIDGTTKRHIINPSVYTLWNGSRGEGLTMLSSDVLNQFSNGTDITSNYVTNGSGNFALDNGSYYSVSGSTATAWGFATPVSVSAAILNHFTNTGQALTNTIRSGSTYYLIKYGLSHATTDTNVANIWGINTAGPSFSQAFVSVATQSDPLTPFVRSTDPSDLRIFVADSGGKLYTLSSIQQLLNYGYVSGNPLQLKPGDINAMTITNAQNILNNGSNYAVLDNGTKRAFSSTQAQSNWLTASNYTAVSNYLWAYIPSGSSIGSTIKGSAPNVYAVSGGQKQWIQSGQTYSSTYAPYQLVSDNLIYLLPNGANIP